MNEQPPISDADLLAYLEEALHSAELARIEQLLRESETLRERLANLAAGENVEHHAVGAIWRRLRLSCPPRERLGSYLLGALESAEAQFITRHLNEFGCRYCQANLDDLRSQAAPALADDPAARRRRLFTSSAGLLQRSEP